MLADEKALLEEAEVWRLREQMVRRSYELVYNFKEDDRVRFEEREADGDRDDGEATRSAFVASAAAVVVGALVLRVGGRAALVSALGLDIIADMGVGDKIDQVVAYADALGIFAVAAFFAAWVVAKVFLIDFISIALAIASGVVFGGVFEGATVSAVGATLPPALRAAMLKPLQRRSQAERRRRPPPHTVRRRAVGRPRTVLPSAGDRSNAAP